MAGPLTLDVAGHRVGITHPDKVVFPELGHTKLDLIDYSVRLWSNPGDLVLSPFAGIGSEGVGAIRRGRRFIGCELKRDYWRVACRNLANAEADANTPLLFDLTGLSA